MQRTSADWTEHDASSLGGVGTPIPDPMPQWHASELEDERLDFFWVPEKDSKPKTGGGKTTKQGTKASTASPKSARKTTSKQPKGGKAKTPTPSDDGEESSDEQPTSERRPRKAAERSKKIIEFRQMKRTTTQQGKLYHPEDRWRKSRRPLER